MSTDKEALRARRQRIWADLAFLEKAMLRYNSIFGSVPEHWKRARDLLWRDLREATAVACTSSAQSLLGAVQRLTINSDEVLARIEKALDGHKVQVRSTHVVHALRNLGKAPGSEVEVGSPTKPLDRLGYPEGWTRLTRR